jgi:hypothetical protein
MKNRILFLLALAFVLFAQGCKPSPGNIDHGQEEAPTNPYLFSDQGFSYISLGDTLVWATITVPDGQVKDTVYNQVTMNAEGKPDTVSWNVKIVRHPDGKVLLESDFEQFAFLGRAQIESPRYINAEGIHVGSTVADLKTAYKDIIVKPFAAFQVYELVHGRQIYHIPMVDQVSDDTSVTLDQLPADAKVIRIVLM